MSNKPAKGISERTLFSEDRQEVSSAPFKLMAGGPSAVASNLNRMNHASDSVSSNSKSRRTSSLTMFTLASMMEQSNSSDLNFSKRSSDLSEDTSHRTLKPAEFMELKRKSERIFPISRLNFAELELVGRDDEKKLLETCLQRVSPQGGGEPTGSRELVLISGNAGTGKTALASALAKSVKRLRGLYVKGKFDLYLRDEPYSGVAAACREICGRILLMRDDDFFVNIRDELIDKLGSENLCLLINIVPELAEIVGDEVIMEDMKKQGSGETKARFNYAFRVLIRIVARNFAPLVILLDDIQWSDAATLDLLQVLIADRDNPSLMVIGIYRFNEVDESHPLSPLICDLKRTSEQDDFNVTEIEIGNLSISQINDVIMRLLSIDDPSETLGFADVCLKRTYGNVFSLLVFLEMLQTEGLLQYSLGAFKWSWDEQKILSETAAASNVVDLMKQKIEKLPASVGQRLSIAACLGFSFEPAILNTVWTTISEQEESTDESNPDAEEDEIESFLVLAEQEGFLEVEPDSTSAYRWVHDKVQEAAISRVLSEELPSLKAQVGRILVDELDDKHLDSYIFTVINLIQEGGVPEDESGRIQLAELSLQASKKAKDQSAFESAGKYATIGVNALPACKWSDHYGLTLDLYSTAAEVEGFLGNIDRLEKLYKEVINQHDRPLFDKLRVYHAVISYMLGALGKHNNLNAIEIMVDILSQLGHSFPKRKGAITRLTKSGTRKAKKIMTSLRPEEISNLPMMEDPVHLEMMRLLDQLFTATYMSASDLMPLTIFARIKLTLEHGLCEYSTLTFAGLALYFRDDPVLASKTGSLARLVMTIIDSKKVDAKAEMWLNTFVFCWTDPITRMSSRLLKSYETGLSVGDNENAIWCIAQYIVIGFQSGKPLATVEADCKIYLKQMIEFEREIVHADISMYFEMVRSLMGRYDSDPTVFRSEQRFLSYTDHTVLGVFYSCQSILYLYFGLYEKGAELASERGDSYLEGIPGHVWGMAETFTRGMLLYVTAQNTGKRVYAKEAKRVHKTIKAWVRQGNPNVQHYDLILNAEAAVLSGKLDAVDECYQKAIVSATRQGCIHESALARERYGEFLLSQKNDPEEARHKFNDAMLRYSEWGAAKKVQMLREKHQDLWQKPPIEVVVGGLSSASKRVSTLGDVGEA